MSEHEHDEDRRGDPPGGDDGGGRASAGGDAQHTAGGSPLGADAAHGPATAQDPAHEPRGIKRPASRMGSDDGEGGGGSDSVSSGGSRGRENSLSGGDSGSDPHGGGGDGHAELDASGAAGAQGNETDELTPPRKRSHFGDGDDAAAAGNGGAGPTTETTGHGGYDADGASTAHASGDVGEFGDAGAERTVSSAGSFAESRASSPMQLHDDDDDAYVSDQEPLPPVPHAPRHPTQGADDDPRPMLPPRALEDGEAVEDGELAAALSPPIDLGDHSSSAAPSAFPSRAPSEAGDMRVGDDATDTGRRASRAAGGLGGLATNGSAPVSRAGSDTDIRGSHRDDGMAEPGSRAGSSSAAARGHSANSAVESNQYVPNSPYSIPPGGSLKSPESRPMSTTSRREHVRFVGCSSHTEYEIQKKIGEGTFGEVTIGRHKSTGDVVALKKILVHNEREGIPITALREIKILKALSHENIISLREIAYKAGDRPRRERGTVYMVFPYMDHDLTGLLENPQVRFTPPQIKSFMRQLLLGVEYMHKNMILHRDMKGSNILLDNQGHLKIGDFGLARTITVPADPSQVKPYTNMVVTRWYRPPELLLGETFYSKPIDMWGVGCVFGEMLRRKPILAGANDPDQLEKIFALCGTPDETSWPDYRRYLEKSNIQGFRTIHKRSIHEKFPPNHYDRHTVSLIDHLLVLDPAKRLSATQALEHDYFFVYPKAAVPGTSDFPPWPTSHELDSRQAKADAASKAGAIEGAGTQAPPVHLPNHFDANYVAHHANSSRSQQHQGHHGGPHRNHHHGRRSGGPSHGDGAANVISASGAAGSMVPPRHHHLPPHMMAPGMFPPPGVFPPQHHSGMAPPSGSFQPPPQFTAPPSMRPWHNPSHNTGYHGGGGGGVGGPGGGGQGGGGGGGPGARRSSRDGDYRSRYDTGGSGGGGGGNNRSRDRQGGSGQSSGVGAVDRRR